MTDEIKSEIDSEIQNFELIWKNIYNTKEKPELNFKDILKTYKILIETYTKITFLSDFCCDEEWKLTTIKHFIRKFGLTFLSINLMV